MKNIIVFLMILATSSMLIAQPTLNPELLNEGVHPEEAELLVQNYQDKIKPLLDKDDVKSIQLWNKLQDKIGTLKERLEPVLDGNSQIETLKAQAEELKNSEMHPEEYRERFQQLKEEFTPVILELYEQAGINVEEEREEFRQILPPNCSVNTILCITCKPETGTIDLKYMPTEEHTEFNPQYPPEYHFSYDQIAFTNTDKNWSGATVPRKKTTTARRNGFTETEFGVIAGVGTVHGYAQVGNYINVPAGTKTVAIIAEYDHKDWTNAFNVFGASWSRTERKIIVTGPQVSHVKSEMIQFSIIPVIGFMDSFDSHTKAKKMAIIFTPAASGGKYQVLFSNHGDAQTVGAVGTANCGSVTKNVKFRVSFYR